MTYTARIRNDGTGTHVVVVPKIIREYTGLKTNDIVEVTLNKIGETQNKQYKPKK